MDIILIDIILVCFGFCLGFLLQERRYSKWCECYKTRLDRDINECEKQLKAIRKTNEK